jgi:hypothetical protein
MSLCECHDLLGCQNGVHPLERKRRPLSKVVGRTTDGYRVELEFWLSGNHTTVLSYVSDCTKLVIQVPHGDRFGQGPPTSKPPTSKRGTAWCSKCKRQLSPTWQHAMGKRVLHITGNSAYQALPASPFKSFNTLVPLVRTSSNQPWTTLLSLHGNGVLVRRGSGNGPSPVDPLWIDQLLGTWTSHAGRYGKCEVGRVALYLSGVASSGVGFGFGFRHDLHSIARSASSHCMMHVPSLYPLVVKSVMSALWMLFSPGHSRIHRELWSTPVSG